MLALLQKAARGELAQRMCHELGKHERTKFHVLSIRGEFQMFYTSDHRIMCAASRDDVGEIEISSYLQKRIMFTVFSTKLVTLRLLRSQKKNRRIEYLL
jgi:hypothetical protein